MNAVRPEGFHTLCVVTGLDSVIQNGTWAKRCLDCRIKFGSDK